jgi:hypothetical protein
MRTPSRRTTSPVITIAMNQLKLLNDNIKLKDHSGTVFTIDNNVGAHCHGGLYKNVRRVAPTNSTVLIHGESGTQGAFTAKTYTTTPQKGNPLSAHQLTRPYRNAFSRANSSGLERRLHRGPWRGRSALRAGQRQAAPSSSTR